MGAPVVILLFVLMLAAPCFVAFRISHRWDGGESDELDPTDGLEREERTEALEAEIILDPPLPASLLSRLKNRVTEQVPTPWAKAEPQENSSTPRAKTPGQLAYEAEADALRAEDFAREAHWAALAAGARAARLRADAEAQEAELSVRNAGDAIRAERRGSPRAA